MIPLSFPMWQVAHGGTQAPWHHEPITNLKSTWENKGWKNVKFCSSIFIPNLRKMSSNINVKSTSYLHTNLISEQSNWVPKLQRLSVQQNSKWKKKTLQQLYGKRKRAKGAKQFSWKAEKNWRLRLWSVKKVLQQMDGKRMSAKWAKHMCWNAARKT